jgi:hypothetical protein
MKFIKNTSEFNFDNFNGQYLNPIIDELINAKRQQLPNVSEHEVILLEDDIVRQLEKISEIYLKPGIRKEKSSPLTQTTILKPSPINSKIISDIASVNKLFD